MASSTADGGEGQRAQDMVFERRGAHEGGVEVSARLLPELFMCTSSTTGRGQRAASYVANSFALLGRGTQGRGFSGADNSDRVAAAVVGI